MVSQKRNDCVSKCKSTTFIHTSYWVPRKDAITRQDVFTLAILGLHRLHMHIRTKLPRNMYRAVSDGKMEADNGRRTGHPAEFPTPKLNKINIFVHVQTNQ